MRLVVLSEAISGNHLESEHGLSYYLEVDGLKILFDTGASHVFGDNAAELGIDLDALDMVVLSHGHFDHGDGLRFLKPTTLICHPGCFVKRYHRDGFRNLGLELSRSEIEKRFHLQTCKEPYQISQHLHFLGEIPRITEFEAGTTPYVKEGGEKDFIMDDSGLACITQLGLVIISGCAHSGICNMIQHAMNVTGIGKIRAVIGGFHLKTIDPQTRETVTYLKELKVRQVLPAHCTMEPALGLFHRVFGYHEVRVGQEFFF